MVVGDIRILPGRAPGFRLIVGAAVLLWGGYLVSTVRRVSGAICAAMCAIDLASSPIHGARKQTRRPVF